MELIGGMAEGQALPAERRLANTWRVSRVTVRRAIEGLVQEGILDRRRGSGTYLTRPRLSRRLTMSSFTEDMRRQGKVPSARALEFREHRADHATARLLRIPAGDPVVSFARLRLADGEPMILEQSTVTAELVPGLTRTDLETSWYELLSDRYGVHVESATFEVTPILPERRVASWLDVPESQPCLQLAIVSFDSRGRVVEAGTAIYRGDAYSLSAHLTPHNNAHLPLR
jgi:GntR family transcriptional regulator